MNNSVFADGNFRNGFIEFCESADFKRYMEPFLKELLEDARRGIESADECRWLQGHISMVRKILDKPEALKRDKSVLAGNSPGYSGQGE